MQSTPCLHLIPIDGGEGSCHIGRAFPADCQACSAYVPGINEAERQRCEVWTRVMGYHRPTTSFNPGKLAEHSDRRYFVERPGDLGAGDGYDTGAD